MSVDQVSDFKIMQISHKTVSRIFWIEKENPEITIPILPPFILYKNDLLYFIPLF